MKSRGLNSCPSIELYRLFYPTREINLWTDSGSGIWTFRLKQMETWSQLKSQLTSSINFLCLMLYIYQANKKLAL